MAKCSVWLEKAEDMSDYLLRKSKRVLPTIARLCLVSTFLDDGIRMLLQWPEQMDYIESVWQCGKDASFSFIFLNCIVQLAGCLAVLTRKCVLEACIALNFTIILQAFVYDIWWVRYFFLRLLGIGGGLLLLVAESKVKRKRHFAGVPSRGEENPKKYLQFTGRVFLALMFLSILHYDTKLMNILQDVVETALMVFVIVGFKTKLCATVLVVWLTCFNFYDNQWWNVFDSDEVKDVLKYEFFQVLSVTGGLLMVITLGPGGMSVDELKKEW